MIAPLEPCGIGASPRHFGTGIYLKKSGDLLLREIDAIRTRILFRDTDSTLERHSIMVSILSIKDLHGAIVA